MINDDITKLATVLQEVVIEIGLRGMPAEYVSKWLNILHPMCSRHTCAACGEPIRFNEEMVGSDVFSIYAHARCEKEALAKWKADETAKKSSQGG